MFRLTKSKESSENTLEDYYTEKEVQAYELGACTVFKILREQLVEHCHTLEEALVFIDSVQKNFDQLAKIKNSRKQ